MQASRLLSDEFIVLPVCECLLTESVMLIRLAPEHQDRVTQALS